MALLNELILSKTREEFIAILKNLEQFSKDKVNTYQIRLLQVYAVNESRDFIRDSEVFRKLGKVIENNTVFKQHLLFGNCNSHDCLFIKIDCHKFCETHKILYSPDPYGTNLSYDFVHKLE